MVGEVATEFPDVQRQDELFDAQQDAAAKQHLGEALGERLNAMVAELADVFSGFDTQVGCEAIRQGELAKIRRQLNAISYIRRLLGLATGR